MSEGEELRARLMRANEYEPLGHDGWEAAAYIEQLERRAAHWERQFKWLEPQFADAKIRIEQLERALPTGEQS